MPPTGLAGSGGALRLQHAADTGDAGLPRQQALICTARASVQRITHRNTGQQVEHIHTHAVLLHPASCIFGARMYIQVDNDDFALRRTRNVQKMYIYNQTFFNDFKGYHSNTALVTL